MDAVYAIAGPLQAELAAEDLRRAPQGATLWSIAPRGRYAVQVNGQWIGRAQWHLPLREGDLIVWVHAAHGGGGSSPLRFVLQIAVLAAAFFAPQLAGFAAGTWQAAATTAAVALAGNSLVNALVPIPGGPTTRQQEQPSPTYSFALSGNNYRPDQPNPVRYGHEFVFPDFVVEPYSEFDGLNDQYFCAAFAWGQGEAEIIQITIDDTPLANFAGVQALRYGPGQATRGGPFSGVEGFDETSDLCDPLIITSVEVGGQSLATTDWIGPFTINGPGTTMDRLFVDLVLPRGLGVVDENGDTYVRAYTVPVEVRAVDDAGLAIGAWASAGSIELEDTTVNPIRGSFAFDLAAGRYQMRIRRTAVPPDPPLSGNVAELGEIVVASARARLTSRRHRVEDHTTGVVVRIKANEQLTMLSQRRIGIVAQRLLPIWDGTAWSDPEATRNPAWAFCDVLRDTRYGRGLADSRIDLATVLELAATWDARQDRFDYTFDTLLTVDDSLRIIARTGRAVPIFRRGCVYSLVRDQLQAGPVAAFMPRNMAQDSFQIDFLLPTEETPDAVRLTYRSAVTWEDAVVVAQYSDGVISAFDEFDAPEELPSPSNPVDIRFPGIIGRSHALREAAFMVADNVYRRVRCSWQTELEGLFPTYGSLVGIAHDVSRWAQSGDVAAYDDGTYRVTPADPVVWTAGQQHYLRIQEPDGSLSEAIAVTRPDAAPSTIQLPSAYAGTIRTDAPQWERTRYLFGALADVLRYVRITGMVPQSEKGIRLEGAIEDERVHEADAEWLPGAAEQDPPSGGGTVIPGEGGEGGTTYVVALTPQAWTDNWLPGSEEGPQVGWDFGNDGVLTSSTPIYPDVEWTAQWLSPRPVTSTVAALYEVRFTYREDRSFGPVAIDENDYVISSDALATWHGLGTARALTVKVPDTEVDTFGSWLLSFDVEIRVAATTTVVALARFDAHFNNIEDPGGP